MPAEAKYHTSIHTLPLNKFIEVMVDDNYAALIISGMPDMDELILASRIICTQYAEAVDDNEQKHYFYTLRDIAVLDITYRQVQGAIPALLTAEDHGIFMPEFYEALNKDLHTDFVFREKDPENNKKNLRRMQNRSKGIKIQLDLKKAQMQGLEEKQKGEKPTRQYYQSLLISLSDHAGYQITDQITTYEFCERIRRLNEYIDQVNRKQYGSSRRR